MSLRVRSNQNNFAGKDIVIKQKLFIVWHPMASDILVEALMCSSANQDSGKISDDDDYKRIFLEQKHLNSESTCIVSGYWLMSWDHSGYGHSQWEMTLL